MFLLMFWHHQQTVTGLILRIGFFSRQAKHAFCENISAVAQFMCSHWQTYSVGGQQVYVLIAILELYTTVQKFGLGEFFFIFEVCNAHKACIYLIENAIKTVLLINIYYYYQYWKQLCVACWNCGTFFQDFFMNVQNTILWIVHYSKEQHLFEIYIFY